MAPPSGPRYPLAMIAGRAASGALVVAFLAASPARAAGPSDTAARPAAAEAPGADGAEPTAATATVPAGATAPTGPGAPAAAPAPASNPLVVGAVSTGLAGVVVASGVLAWWREAGYAGWSWYDSGFFGRTTYAGGSDKAGHFYSWYVGVHALTGIYEALGVSHGRSVAAAASFSVAMSTVVELVDGFTKFGFEWPDVVANVAGAAFGVAQELSPSLDALVGVRIGYVPTPEFMGRSFNYFKLINDYSGMIFYVDFKPAGLERAFGVSPGAARYFTVGLTYGTFGYDPRDTPKRRNLGLYVGLNVPEILDAALGSENVAVRAAEAFTRYYAIPFTSVAAIDDLNDGSRRVGFGVANRLEL